MAALRRLAIRARCFKNIFAGVRHNADLLSTTTDGSCLPPLELKHPWPVSTKVIASPSLRASIVCTHSSIIVSTCQERIAPAIMPTLPAGRSPNINLPSIPGRTSLEMPTIAATLLNTHILPERVKIEAPQYGPIVEKQAIRAIVRRHRKMKKHKLRKLRKKFRIQISKMKAKRRRRKERIFQSGLLDKLVAAERFDAKQYVAAKLKSAYEPLPEKPTFPKSHPWQFRPEIWYSQYKK